MTVDNEMSTFAMKSKIELSHSPVELRLECVVDAEGVAALYVLGLGALDEDPLTRLADGERLQRPRQLPVRDGGLLLDLVVRVRVAAVEQQQHAHLVPAMHRGR